jgi:hypothetical protein
MVFVSIVTPGSNLLQIHERDNVDKLSEGNMLHAIRLNK